MSGLLFLAKDDFKCVDGKNGQLMCSEIPGFSLILFYSTQCSHCQNMIPIFKSLPGSISGCQFGMINVSKNKDIVKMSRETLAPITYVPYVILFHDGRPHMRYDGPADATEIQNFVVEVANSIQSRQSFTNDKKQNSKDKFIPDYTIGIPKQSTREDVCYLDFTEAYES